jgi:hypothetical protein
MGRNHLVIGRENPSFDVGKRKFGSTAVIPDTVEISVRNFVRPWLLFDLTQFSGGDRIL